MVVIRKEFNLLLFVVGRNGEFGESYYIRSFWIGNTVSVEFMIYMLTQIG